MEPSIEAQTGGTKKRFGVFEFDPRTHELTKHGVRLRLQEQPIQVLAVLLEQAGQIVPREELQRRLWPDGTFVDYEQSLNKAVNKLREALGDSADHPIYIETLARRGYRFVAPVDVDRKVEPVAKTAAPLRQVPVWLAAGATVLGVVMTTGLWPISAPQVERVVPLTTDTTRKSPPLISDGSRVLFGDTSDLWTVPASGGEPKRLSLPFLRSDRPKGLLGFSPLRQQLLLFSSNAGNSGEDELWLAGTDGEAPRKIGDFTPLYGAALSADAERIALSKTDGVYIQSIGDGERKKIHAMTGAWAPALWWHPSGRRVGFLENVTDRSKFRAWQVNDDGTYPRRIVPEAEHPQGAGVWSRDGKRFFYFCLDGEVFVRTQGGILGWLREPVVTRLTASGQFRSSPAIDPVNPRRLFAVGSVLRGETMRYDRKARRWVSFLDGFSGEMIDPSPDGQWMAYVSYPGGELHKCRIDGSSDVLLASGVLAVNPSWSPDGTRIAFAGRLAAEFRNLDLWLVSAGGGDAAPYSPEIESGYDARWSADGKRILLGQDYTPGPHQSHVRTIHLDRGKVEMIPGTEKLFSARWSPDERQILALDWDTNKLRVYNAVKREWRQLAEMPVRYPTWSHDGKYVYATEGTRSAAEAFRIEVATGRREEIARMDFRTIGNVDYWVGWTKDWEPLTLRDLSSTQVYRIELDR